MDHSDMRRPTHILAGVCLGLLTLAVSTSASANDLVQEAVGKVSRGQYKSYQIDIENMGLGLYGGPDYNQDHRNRDGWFGGGTLGNAETVLYLTDQFLSLGLDVLVQGDYANVVAELPGIARPNDVYIVCGHYDSTTGDERAGGDYNASGTTGVRELARILTQYQAEATLRFIGFNAEEDWMLGSEDYVTTVLSASEDNVLGVINLDMILRPAWDSDPQATVDLDIATGDSALCLAWVDTFVETAAIYTPSLVIDADSPNTTYWYASDQGPFISDGYAAFMLSEGTAIEIWSGSNEYYHSAQDASDALANDSNSPSGVTYDYGFATDVVRATVATLAEQAGLGPSDAAAFHEYQSIATDGASDLEFFSLGDHSYLAVAQDGNDVTANVDSTVYRWDGVGFVEYQRIPTSGARDWEFFTIADDAYLAVANATDGITHLVDSQVFRWDGDRFVEHQSLSTAGAADCEFFTIGDDHYLAAANAHDDITSNMNSTIYKWTGTQFHPSQFIRTHGARDFESFTIEGETFLAVANAYDDQTHNIDSVLYRWNGIQFLEFQTIATSGAADWEFFTIGTDAYLAVASGDDNVTCELNSKLYKWDGAGFTLLQSLPTYGAGNWESFTIDEVPYLAVANADGGDSPDGDSRIYKWNGTRFVESASISASEARDGAFFTIDGTAYLGLAQIASDGTQNGVLTLHQHH